MNITYNISLDMPKVASETDVIDSRGARNGWLFLRLGLFAELAGKGRQKGGRERY